MLVRGAPRRPLVVALGVVGALIVVAAVVVTVRSRSAGGSRLLWADNFSGRAGAAPSSKDWQVQTGYFGKPYHSLECMTDRRANSAQDGEGHLQIVAQREPTSCGDAGTKDYSSARLTSHGLHSMRYGYLEIRAKMAGGSGMWNALWLLGSNYSEVGWPRCGEIDVSEVTSRASTLTYATIHAPGQGTNPIALSGDRYSSSLSTAFHAYGLSWTPNELRFTFDGYVYRTITRAQVERTGTWVFNHDFDVVLNLTVGGDWPRSPAADETFPRALTVDYVRVYSGVPNSA